MIKFTFWGMLFLVCRLDKVVGKVSWKEIVDVKRAVHKNSEQDRIKTQKHTNKLICLWDWKDKAYVIKHDLGIWMQILQRNKCRHLVRKHLHQRKCVLDQILTASLCLCTAPEMESHTCSASLHSWIALAPQHGGARICGALAPWPEGQ